MSSKNKIETAVEIDRNWGLLRAKGFRRVYMTKEVYASRRDVIISKKGKVWVAEEVDAETGVVGKVKAKANILFALLKHIN
ncbi:hypothetical protein RHO99_18490 [Salmonella enterica subsp. enterica serovar Typhimurium]|uniref:Uncharacterized protein n=1 Tax=Salmonella phage SE14 TaxID=2592196 RepID=A0A5C0CB92_9CAUD|nr:hypothetical protein HYP87_gp152 [Salmonella phage SE14]EKE9231601.1 hypothetical protein [Salmonella enterica]MDR5209326.1 hypothetical protein [Salmonella enterica subsp. enterica serovar Typhimurium]WES09829.1 hypothetical protein [Salmonella phage SWJM-01]MDR5309737.1 hypothetical protein [Salmonella enterica subsp. enterica serovar Typhimurium]QEI23460.1 hypothetical protein [Salmonella phage SE14]